MSESMIERVARAIFEEWRETEHAEATWEDALKGHAAGEAEYPAFFRTVELAHREARAAIEAMREPTDAMTFAGMREAKRVGGAISSTEINSVLAAAIDAALNEHANAR